jgi:hypothetical protein
MQGVEEKKKKCQLCPLLVSVMKLFRLDLATGLFVLQLLFFKYWPNVIVMNVRKQINYIVINCTTKQFILLANMTTNNK